MKKNKTLEGFIRKLIANDHEEYAAELKEIITADINQGYAEWILSRMRMSLLSRILEFVCSSDKNRRESHEEIVRQLSVFDSRNANHNGKPWLSIRYITSELDAFLTKPQFWKHCTILFNDSPDITKAINKIKLNASLSRLRVKFFYNSENNLQIAIQGQILHDGNYE